MSSYYECSYLEALGATLKALPAWREAHQGIQQRVVHKLTRLKKTFDHINERNRVKGLFMAKEDQVHS
jgi:hypothetical protein